MAAYKTAKWSFLLLAAIAFGICTSRSSVMAEDPVKGDATKADATKTETAKTTPAEELTEEQLANRQQAIASRYQRFEQLLLQLAEYMRKTDPEKADLLIRAIGKSKENRVSAQMKRVIADLQANDPSFGDAIERQDELVSSLRDLLSLLQSEDRRNEIQDEIKRLEGVVKDLRKVIGQEKVARATTERGTDSDEAEGQQKKVGENTDKLLDKIKKHDDKKAREARDSESQSGKSQYGESKDGESKDGESKDGESKDGESKDGESKDGESKDGETKDGEPKDSKDGEDKEGEKPGDEKKPGEPKDGEQKSGEQKSGEQKSGEQKSGEQKSGEQKSGEQKSGEQQDQQQQQDQQAEQEKTPGREEIEAARDEMEKAIRELKKQNKEGANEAQDKALAKLIKAKEELEEILRQLREEERELMLAALEARFRKMLSMQIEVFNGTVKVARVPEDKRNDTHRTRSRQLGQLENDISLEASKVLQLLKEEGTSVAFPIAVEDLQEDMYTVSRRLEESQVGDLTQTIEQDIVEALSEMVEALQKEMEKSEEEKKKQQQQQQGQQGDPSLVDMIGELKMLRTLQQRVNRRTRTLGRLINGDQADDPEVVTELEKLGQRQARIQKTAYDLATKRNK